MIFLNSVQHLAIFIIAISLITLLILLPTLLSKQNHINNKGKNCECKYNANPTLLQTPTKPFKTVDKMLNDIPTSNIDESPDRSQYRSLSLTFNNKGKATKQ